MSTMSTSSLLALTMMIGTSLEARNLSDRRQPRHLGQHQIEQHEVERLFAEKGDGLLSIASDRHVETLAVEADGQRIDEGLFILDEQNIDALFG